MNDERREREEIARLERLFRADPGPSPAELAEARLLLKRTLERDRAREPASLAPGERPLAAGERVIRLRFSPRRVGWRLTQAAGFALLVALLVPVLPRILPERRATREGPDLVASLAHGARSVHARLKPWLPSLPPLPEIPLRTPGSMEMRGGPAGALFDWIPSLHSEAR